MTGVSGSSQGNKWRTSFQKWNKTTHRARRPRKLVREPMCGRAALLVVTALAISFTRFSVER
jgi:hypothetical protein